MDWAPLLAADLRAPVVTDAIELSWSDGSLSAVRLGACDNMRCEVLDGVEEGQSVRIRG